MKPLSDHVRAVTLVIWNVNIPLDEDLKETVDKLDLVDEKALLPATRMSNIFPKQPEGGHIHVVVKELPMTITIPQKRMLSEPPENVFDRLKRAKIVTDAPSETGKSAKYQSLQGDPLERIYDDLPPDPDIPPIPLLYEGFGHFLDIMNGHKNVPGLADVDVQELRNEVDELASKMTGYFSKKDDRRDEALACLNCIFSARRGIKIPQPYAAATGSVRTDGHNTEIHGPGTMIVVFKNCPTGISSLPQVELVCYAARLAATRMDEQLYLRWRVPFVGLTIVGCNITFYAIIAIDHRFRIVSLTPGFSCIPSASGGQDRTSLYSAFTAASVLQAHILQDSERLLNNPPAVIPADARRFPAISKLRKYPPSSNDYFAFEIGCFFPDRQPYRLLYAAVTPDRQFVLVKFSRRYPIELHEFCANSGHAPRIFAFEQLPGGWCAVVMDYIESGLPITDPSLPPVHQHRWAAELQRLMDDFHSKDLVHGDLRAANIICKGDSVMLIDFDWGGKAGEVFYPTLNLNDELLHGRASDDLRITKEDDRRVLRNTLAKLMNICG
ncbi:hypothetical protein M378DRAFT_68187 [Amanita muscaria Koide BX008]|uniref:Crinkler effector protein N-terminal domain-containing protein n=1 Tax=Amanita muscaria (strain Koide BX008) TaxID=946122 RepID=A0A0C2T3L7_AMAMK|nr:hypothetical protein M378DRAFT_68187 [Amanita muscaria Koide BX008]